MIFEISRTLSYKKVLKRIVFKIENDFQDSDNSKNELKDMISQEPPKKSKKEDFSLLG